jgi:hypothetical protein
MTATTTARMNKTAGFNLPRFGTYGAAANSLFLMGTLVVRDSAGRAAVPTDGDGLHCCGVARNTYDNRTGSEYGGAADAIDIEVTYDVVECDVDGTAPIAGDIVYVVDNKTVSISSNGGTRGIAGVVSEVRDSKPYVWVGPHVAALAAGSIGQINLPLNGFRIASSGAAMAAFGAGTADGIDPTAESFGIRWNDDSTVAFAQCVPMPADYRAGTPMLIQASGYRVGSADPTAALTFAVFFHVAGAAFSADADAGGASSAFDGATTIVTTETREIAGADVPAGAVSMALTMVPTAALDDDDLVVTAVKILYIRK